METQRVINTLGGGDELINRELEAITSTITRGQLLLFVVANLRDFSKCAQ